MLAGGEIGPHLPIEYWDTFSDHSAAIIERLDALLKETASSTPSDREKAMNELFGLWETGFVKDMRQEENKLKVDALQVLSPYRGGGPGTLRSMS